MSEWRTDSVKTTGGVSSVSSSTSTGRPKSRGHDVPQHGPAGPVAPQALKAAVDKLQAFAKQHDRNLQFRIDDGTGRIVVSIVDATTGDLIRQIPAESTLQLARQVDSGHLSLLDGELRA